MSEARSLDRPLGAFFLIAFAWTWGIGGLMIFAPEFAARVTGPLTPGNPLFFIAVYAPAISAIAVTAYTRGAAGVRVLLAKLVQWRFNPLLYAFVLVGVPLIAIIAGHAGQVVMGIEPPAHRPLILKWASVLPVALLLDPGPLGEELGWRGFALPRMIQRWKAPAASILLGLIWGVWHYPAFKVPTLPQSGLSFPVFVAGAVVLSVLAAWLVVRTSGSVLITILFHLAVNTSLGVFQPPFAMFVAVLGTVAVAVLILDRTFRNSDGADLKT